MRKRTKDQKNNMIEPYDSQLMAWAATSSRVKIKHIKTDTDDYYDIAITEPSGLTWIYFVDASMHMLDLLRTRLLEAHFNETLEKRDA